jgi:plastocyanin
VLVPLSRAIPALTVCAALLLAAGCGSSSSATSSSGSASTSTPTAPSSRLRPTTTPKFAAPPSSAPVRSGLVKISYRNITIQPDTLKVKAGSTIRWTNLDSVEHNVTSEGGPQKFASKNFGEGASFEIKATKPGVIHYECTIHPASMNGTIEVVN